jgi:mRNA interferase MazF
MDTADKFNQWNEVKKKAEDNKRITSTIKDNDYFHSFEYINKSNGLTKNSAMILQVRTFSIKRLMNKTGVICKKDFEVVIEKSKRLFSPT